jgi:release factor glutamine methyltransferase
MGTGSGIIGFACIRVGAHSVAFADINPDAIRNLKKRGLKAILSDLFAEVKDSFDLIVFNPPYLPFDERENKKSSLATTGGKEGDEVICRFLTQVSRHLNPGGKILLLISSLTPRKRLESICNKQGFKISVVAEEKLSFEQLFVLLIEANSFKPAKSK